MARPVAWLTELATVLTARHPSLAYVGSVILAQFIPLLFEHVFVYATGHASLGSQRPHPDPPIAAPLEHCAELLDVDLAVIREAAAHVEPYLRVDGSKVWSLMQLERHLHPDAYGRVSGGYIARRRPRATGLLHR